MHLNARTDRVRVRRDQPQMRKLASWRTRFHREDWPNWTTALTEQQLMEEVWTDLNAGPAPAYSWEWEDVEIGYRHYVAWTPEAGWCLR